VAVTYDMNILQRLKSRTTILVTLNRSDAIRPETVIKRLTYHHPVFTAASLQAQQRWEEINGVRRTWYAGAYWGYGFHEDGVNSAHRICSALTDMGVSG
jgi:predicted NAD/FAD-binding protein